MGNYCTLLADAESLNAGMVVGKALLQKLLKAFSIREEQREVSDSMHIYSANSLLAVELRSWSGKKFGVDVAILDLLGGATSAAVGQTVAGKSPFCRVVTDKQERKTEEVAIRKLQGHLMLLVRKIDGLRGISRPLIEAAKKRMNETR